MAQLINLDNITLAYGLDPLLDHAKLQINTGERVCIIGRNGAGKSSLLKLIDGTLLPDSGTISRMPTLKVARLAQELPSDQSLTVYDYVADVLDATGKLLAQYHDLTHRLTQQASNQDLAQLERLQRDIDTVNGWQMEKQIETILSQLSLQSDTKISDLSGGWQRRAALAKALVIKPDLLLLDEPTNHLDIDAIQWLEEQLIQLNVALVFVTHDRAFLKRVATRIVELDRGELSSWPGDYENFLRRKEEMLNAETLHHAAFDKKLAQEERWIRQGIKARRTRNEGRVRALKAMRLERQKRREQIAVSRFNLNESIKSGQLVIDAEHISQEFNGHCVISDFSIRIMRGDRIGLIGPNGAGKSTLLNILLGKMRPQSGDVKLGTNLLIGYFDQLRQSLNLDKTVFDNIAEGSDEIEINGKKRHIISYLSDFLFTPQRALTPVKALSGGECNRLVLAKLLSQPTNLLVLDEPTNDLDIETLELLEELLSEYQGTLLIVSHDREFLDHLVTSTLVFSGHGKIVEYVGGYSDYLQYASQIKTEQSASKGVSKEKVEHSQPTANRKMSYKEQRELELLPQQIETLEQKQHALQTQISDPGFYQQSPQTVSSTLEELNQINLEIEKAYQRWQALEK